ncbi:hypothetical protein ACIPV2_09375 [Microbacterium sp. NPDC089987]|uniref:hypothetical protein n=1 Tax=Microbacterium sp. NPDC089987 TaxID=3364202 RepID=UPI0038115863
MTQSIWVPGRSGWTGRGSNPAATGIALTCFGIIALVGGGWLASLLLSSPSPAVFAFALSLMALIACTAWAVVAQLGVQRRRILRLRVEGEMVEFGPPTRTRLPLRLLGIPGLALAASVVWVLTTGELASTTRYGPAVMFVPAAAAVVCSIRGWRGPVGSVLSMTPQQVGLRCQGREVSAPWGDVAFAGLAEQHAVVRMRDGRELRWAPRDLASDPILLTELIAHYAATPASRREIGAGTVALLRSGEF